MDILNIKPTGKTDKTQAVFQDSSTAYNDPVAYNAAIPYGGSDRRQDIPITTLSIENIKPVTSLQKP